MNRINKKFAELKKRGERAFIPFLTAGDPDIETTVDIIESADEAGADIIELGFPFSDPVADGPTIQASYSKVLGKGQKNEDVFRMVEKIRQKSSIPIVAMISYSLVFKMGFENFINRAVSSGIDGATIPDLPAEEAEKFVPDCDRHNFSLISFTTPGTSFRRREKLLSMGRGFVYYIAVRGITGQRASMPEDLNDNIEQIKKQTALPVSVGFGISNPTQAQAVAEVADGVIVGSAIMSRITDSVKNGKNPVNETLSFISELSGAVKNIPEDK